MSEKLQDMMASANDILARIRADLPSIPEPTTDIDKLAAELDAVVHEDWASISADDVRRALGKLGLSLVKTTP